MSEQCGGKKEFCVGSCGNGKPGLREEEGRGYALDTLAREIPGYLCTRSAARYAERALSLGRLSSWLSNRVNLPRGCIFSGYSPRDQ